MNQVTRRRLKRLTVGDYDLGHLDSACHMELNSIATAMRALLHTEFTALLARTGTSQAGFARLAGFSPRHVNNWCRRRAAVPPWAAALAAILDERSPDALEMMVDEAHCRWHETLGVPPGVATEEIDCALRRLARRYAPDQGGTEGQRTRIDTACAQARTTVEGRPLAEDTALPARDSPHRRPAPAAAPLKCSRIKLKLQR